MRIFRDSVTPSEIPLDGIEGVMGYANGRFRWTAEETGRFTKAGLQVAMVDVNATAPHLAAILDVETGDAGPAQAPGWIRQRNAFRGDAVIYCELETVPGLLAACSQFREPWRLLVALWDGSSAAPHLDLPAGVTLLGKQFLNTAGYDESVIYDDSWHRP